MMAYEIAANPPNLEAVAEEIEKLKKEAEAKNAEEEIDVEMPDVEEVEKNPAKAKAKSKAEANATPKKRTSPRMSRKAGSVDENTTDVVMEDYEAAPPSRRRSRTSTAADTKAEKNPRKRVKVAPTKELASTGSANEEMSSTSPEKNSSPVPPTGSLSSSDLNDPVTELAKILRSIRHRLQRAFIVENPAPTSEEFPVLSRYISRLGEIPDLEASIMKSSKIKKVLTAIYRKPVIAEDATYGFRVRIGKILELWNKTDLNTGFVESGAASPAPVTTADVAVTADVATTTDVPVTSDANPDFTSNPPPPSPSPPPPPATAAVAPVVDSVPIPEVPVAAPVVYPVPVPAASIASTAVIADSASVSATLTATTTITAIATDPVSVPASATPTAVIANPESVSPPGPVIATYTAPISPTEPVLVSVTATEPVHVSASVDPVPISAAAATTAGF